MTNKTNNGVRTMKTTRLSLLLTLIAVFSVTAFSNAFAAERDIKIPFYDAWINSPHADFTSEAFAHWNDEEVKAVPERCAACHSTTGHVDFLGADGSEMGKVDKPAPVEEGVACVACHNRVSGNLEEITFPSKMTVERFEDDARCMDCHQGRASGNSVRDMIAKVGVGMDESNADVKFVNVHYSAAAATRFGSEAGGGFEYDGKDYNGLQFHDDFATQCNDCHNPHTTEVKFDTCIECHDSVDTKDDIAFIRESEGDFDADGDTKEGVKGEIEGLHAVLYAAIQSYAKDVVGTQIVYDAHSYPYFFADSNGNGAKDDDEGAYKEFTPRLAQAVYNYQFVAKDHGAYAHNAPYVIQLMSDSIQDLGEKVKVPKTSRPE
jgi:hypothetical protein